MHFRWFVGRFVSFIGLCALVSACGEEPDEFSPEDEQVTGQVAGALDSNHDVAEVTRPLAEPVAGTDAIVVARAKLLAARDGWQRWEDLRLGQCVTIVTDAATTATFIEATFDECNIPGFFGLVTLSGHLRADLTIDDLTPLAVTFVIVIDDITITAPRGDRSFSGSFSLRQTGDAPVEYAGALDFTGLDDNTLSYDAEASWRVTQGCVNDLTGDAVLSGTILGDLGPIALSGDGIDRCADACPTTGTVQLSYGRGIYLTWDYTGADTALIQGPNGKQLDVTLPCAD